MGLFDKKLSAPFGQSAAPQVNPYDLRPDPVGPPTMPEDISEGAYTWHNAHLMMAQAQASAWFGPNAANCGQVAATCHTQVASLLEAVAPHLMDWALHPEFILDAKFRSNLKFDPMRDQELALVGSPEGTRLQALLAELGAKMTPAPDGSLVGTWPTHFGTAFVQSCTLCVTPSGDRYFYWHSTVLVSNRPVAPGNTFADDLAIAVSVPQFLQTAAYLAETPFPSSMLTFDRDTLLGKDGGMLPSPIAVRSDFAHCLVRTSANELHSSGVATRVDLGNVFSASLNDDELRRAIVIAADGGMHFQTIVEDGYRNYSKSDELEFQLNLFAGAAFPERGDQRWLAAVALPELMTRCVNLIQLHGSDPTINVAVDKALVEQAIGVPFVWAVNNTVFSRLIPSGAYAASIDLLELAIGLDEGIESLNARSNRAVVEYELGDRPASVALFEALLDINEPYVEAEPRFYLGKIARDAGDVETARRHFQWVIDHDPQGSSYVARAIEELAKLPSTSAAVSPATAPVAPGITAAPEAKFCAMCGTPRVPGGRFCGNCGSAFA